MERTEYFKNYYKQHKNIILNRVKEHYLENRILKKNNIQVSPLKVDKFKVIIDWHKSSPIQKIK